MIYIDSTKSKTLRIPLPIFYDGGKHRPKNDDNTIFASRSIPFTGSEHIEWQFGYDSTLTDINSGKKQSSLDKYIFTGAKGDKKVPFEFSEIVNDAINCGLLSKRQISDLRKRVENVQENIEAKYNPVLRATPSIESDGIEFDCFEKVFHTRRKTYPTGERIDIEVKPQQYAAGIQPMLYLNIFLKNLENPGQFIGRTARPKEMGYWIVNENNVCILLDTFVMLAQMSSRHKHDVIEILKILENIH